MYIGWPDQDKIGEISTGRVFKFPALDGRVKGENCYCRIILGGIGAVTWREGMVW